MNTRAYIISLLLLTPQICPGQSIVDDLSSPVESYGSSDTFIEKIHRISSSKKIFIISNNNRELNKGDFISLIVEDDLALRALVAKVDNDRVGIKVLKIYSLTQWGKIRLGLDVKIIKGDDSYYAKNKEDKKPSNDLKNDDGLTESLLKDGTSSGIGDYDDLFGDGAIQDAFSLQDKGNRIIKPDNIVGLTYSNFTLNDAYGNTDTFEQWGFQWAYQIKANIWIEGVYGNNLTPKANFPGPDIETTISDFIGRVKYTIRAPMYSYFMPYIGVRYRTANSPEAGTPARDGIISGADLARELEVVDELQGISPAIGVTWLKRLVPGWFFQANIGTDVMNAGFSIEF